MKYTTNSAVAICAGIAMAWLVGCAPTTHVTETTTTREYDTTSPPVMAPAVNLTPPRRPGTTMAPCSGRTHSRVPTQRLIRAQPR